MTNKKTESHPKEGERLEDDFKGYTMEELQYQRALLALKKEFLKEKALHTLSAVKEQVPLIGGSISATGLQHKGIAGKLLKSLNFADYLLLGVQGIRIGRKIGSLFKKK